MKSCGAKMSLTLNEPIYNVLCLILELANLDDKLRV